MSETQFAGKVIIVTGSTKGIGKAIAIKLVEQGAEVIVTGRSADVCAAVADELKSTGPGTVTPVAGDISSAEGCDAFASAVAALGKEIYGIILNAGIFATEDFFETDDERWMKYFQLNIMSCVRLARHFMKGMLERKAGRVLIIASEAGVRVIPHMIPYSVSKSAVIGLAHGLAKLTRGTEVTVNSVLAGPTMTEGVSEFLHGMAAKDGVTHEEAMEKYFELNEPTSILARFLRPEEVAATVAFLASPAASGINGAAQRVEGGIIDSI
jgi:NAD(P)-dependent dehydrogenase (short-subunit alcohol dehydrogenase family)